VSLMQDAAVDAILARARQIRLDRRKVCSGPSSPILRNWRRQLLWPMQLGGKIHRCARSVRHALSGAESENTFAQASMTLRQSGVCHTGGEQQAPRAFPRTPSSTSTTVRRRPLPSPSPPGLGRPRERRRAAVQELLSSLVTRLWVGHHALFLFLPGSFECHPAMQWQ
jgi:hypothetical protein